MASGPVPRPRTIEQMAAAPADLPAAKAAVEDMWKSTEERLAKVNAERAALKQPDDLKVVYDKTFDKLIAAPSVAMENSMQALLVGLDASSKLVDYINSHRSKLSVAGSQIQAKDQRTLDEIGVLMKAHQAASERFAAARREGDRVLGD